MANSPTPWRGASPETVQTSEPGDVVGAERAEPVGAVGDDAGHVRERLDVVDERRDARRRVGRTGELDAGGAAAGLRRRRYGQLLDAAPERRRDRGERRSAVEHLEQRGLLAVEVARGPANTSISTSRLQPASVIVCTAARTRASSGANDSLSATTTPRRADGAGGDERALDDTERVAAQAACGP